MSFRLVDLIFDVPGLSVTEHMILNAICRAASNDDHTCFPSKAWIALKSRQSPRQVQRIIPQLIEKGYITLLVKGNGKGNVSNFKVNVASLKELVAKGDTQSPIEANKENDSDQPKEDSQSPYIDKPNVTYTGQRETPEYVKGDGGVGQRETPATPKGDTSVSYIGVIGKESGRTKSVSAIGLTAGAHAKATAARISAVKNADISELVIQIALRHPRSRMRMWTRQNVGQADETSILEAILTESQETRTPEAEVAGMMLLLLDAWDEVPREKWQFAPAIPRFYKQGDYRVHPNELPGIAPREGAKHGTGKRTSNRGTTDVSAAFRELLDAESNTIHGDLAVVDDVSGDVRTDGDSGGGEGLPSLPEFPDAAPVDPGVQPCTGREQVPPKPSYPARIEWPRRNGG